MFTNSQKRKTQYLTVSDNSLTSTKGFHKRLNIMQIDGKIENMTNPHGIIQKRDKGWHLAKREH